MPKLKIKGKPVKSKTVAPDWHWIALGDITADPEVQARVELSEEVISDYAQAMLEQIQEAPEGDDPLKFLKFPPCKVFDDGSVLWLADGFHRHGAAGRTGGKVHSLLCEKCKGTKRDAMLYALGANADHGLRRSSSDKRRAVILMLRDDVWGKWSSSQIADQCNVSHTLVDNLRNELGAQACTTESKDAGRKYITKHGTESTMRKRRARKQKAKPAEESKPASSVASPDRKEGDEPAPAGSEHRDWLRVSSTDAAVTEGPVAGSNVSEVEEDLRDRIKALQGRITELEAKGPGDDMAASEFLTAIKKWEDLHNTDQTIIADERAKNARLENEIANKNGAVVKLEAEVMNLRAGRLTLSGAAEEPQTQAEKLERGIGLIESAANDTWPTKMPNEECKKGKGELRSPLPRLRGWVDRIELYAEKDAAAAERKNGRAERAKP
jgi:hypothetical protein